MDRIDEFASQSQKEYGDFDGSITAFDYRKFAELIIQECAEFSRQHNLEKADRSYMIHTAIKQHFGVK